MYLIEYSFVFALIMTYQLTGFQYGGVEQLQVEITNIQNHKGKILVAIYDSQKSFLSEPLQYKIVAVDGSAKFPTSVQAVFEGLSVGDYAVSVYHDENENFVLDRNWLGIPKEMFGFSNNAKAKFSPPTFEECKIHIEAIEGNERLEKLQIRLKNW